MDIPFYNKIIRKQNFNRFLKESIDRTALPPPTVIYPKDINPEMLDPTEQPLYRDNLPPLIDWRAFDQKFLDFYRLYYQLLLFLRHYGQVPLDWHRQIEIALGLPANSIPEDIEIGVAFEEFIRDTLIYNFDEFYPNATPEQRTTFTELIRQFKWHLRHLWDQFDGTIPRVIHDDFESPRVPRNQPKPNLPKKPFWPGHADGVVG